jgi:hypothetical protein
MNLNDLFTVTTLTDAVQKLPLIPGYLEQIGLFEKKYIRTTSILVDVKNGVLTLVPSIPRGGNPAPVDHASRSAISFTAAHLVEQDVVLPEDVQDIRAFGKESVEAGLTAQAAVINDKLTDLKNNLAVTLEYHRVGALGGQVLDAGGGILTDLYTAFGVVKQTAAIALSAAATDVRGALVNVKRAAEKKLGGVPVSGFTALCHPGFLDALTDHSKVKAAYANWQAAQDRLGGDLRGGFVFAGIEFIEYNASVGGVEYIPEDKARFFPRARGLFKQYFAPADYNSAVNTLGQEYYAISEERPKGKGWDLEAQTNPITLCHYPEALVELEAT